MNMKFMKLDFRFAAVTLDDIVSEDAGYISVPFGNLVNT